MLLFTAASYSQVAINTDGSDPDPSAMLEMKSTSTGFLIPRVTLNDINTPDPVTDPHEGLLIYNIDGSVDHGLYIWNGTRWIAITGDCIIPSAPGTITGDATVANNATGVSYSISSVSGATGYNWTVPTGASVVGGQGTTDITVNFGTTSGDVSVRAENTCGNSSYTDKAVTLSSCSSVTYGGQTYSSVEIDDQCWMAENLNIGTRIDGDTDQTNNSTIEKYCYDDDTDNCDTYGGLYQWDEMMQYVTTEGTQGICPAGWHLPTDAEWTTLTNFLGGESVAGGKMKEEGLDHWQTPNTGATNSSGFTGLPGGFRGPEWFVLAISRTLRLLLVVERGWSECVEPVLVLR